MIRPASLVFIMAIASLAVLAGAAEVVFAEKVIVAFGDSTTAPRGPLVVYASLIEKALAARSTPAKVINAGIPGHTTADARARLEKDVLAKHPNLVIVQFGINDAAVNVWQNPPATKPTVSLEDYEKNLRHIVQTVKSRGAEVILMTPNPCRWTKELLRLYGKPPYRPNDPDGFNVLLTDYATIVRRLAQQEHVTLVDVYAEYGDYGKQPGQSVDNLLLDGMHPNAKGHKLVAKLLLAAKPFGDGHANR